MRTSGRLSIPLVAFEGRAAAWAAESIQPADALDSRFQAASFVGLAWALSR
jgi:hypothetical protein